MSSQAHTQGRVLPPSRLIRMFLPTSLFSPGQTLPVREETPSSNLQLIRGAQTPLPPAPLGLAAPNGSAAAPDPPDFTFSSRDQAGTDRFPCLIPCCLQGHTSSLLQLSPALFPVSSGEGIAINFSLGRTHCFLYARGKGNGFVAKELFLIVTCIQHGQRGGCRVGIAEKGVGGCRDNSLSSSHGKPRGVCPAPSATRERSLSLGSSSSLSLPVHIPNKSSPKCAAQLNLRRRKDTSQHRPGSVK